MQLILQGGRSKLSNPLFVLHAAGLVCKSIHPALRLVQNLVFQLPWITGLKMSTVPTGKIEKPSKDTNLCCKCSICLKNLLSFTHIIKWLFQHIMWVIVLHWQQVIILEMMMKTLHSIQLDTKISYTSTIYKPTNQDLLTSYYNHPDQSLSNIQQSYLVTIIRMVVIFRKNAVW